MYSNLRTENNRSNHLLKDIFKIGGYQDDIVEVKESNIKRLKKERILPYAQLQNHIFNAERTKNKDILVKYNKDNELMNYKGDKDKIILKRFIPKYVKWKFFSFKPLSQSKTQNCGL